MADETRTSTLPTQRSSTALTPAGVDDPTAVRPRNRKGPTSSHAANSPSLTPRDSTTPSRGVSPMPSARLSRTKFRTSGRSSPTNAFSRGLLEGSWAPSWASVQDFASSLLEGGYSSEPSRPNSRDGSKPRPKSIWKGFGASSTNLTKSSDSWGPAPPSRSRPSPDDIAAGSLAEREAQLKARKTASVLESHEGVNGGLDVTGKYKRRNSDENPRSTSQPVIQDHLVYLHHVQRTDTYAGIVLRYRCMEHAFRRMNGLWSRDNIQVRKHLLIPVDACEIKGRPCSPPLCHSQVDHLESSPQPPDLTNQGISSPGSQQPLHDDYFGSLNGKNAEQSRQADEEPPWTHVRWVKIDSLQDPVEIVRVKRTAVGYFPPRRKKSTHTVSTFSTPRHSLELSKAAVDSSGVTDSPGGFSSRRQSSTSARPSFGSPSTRSRVGSIGQGDGVPAWMRRPGGVGTMGRSVKAPGPAKDYFNTWVNRRLPGFNIDSMPSMSVMGSETAHFGFNNGREENSGIVESPFEDGRDVTAPSRNGMGLEQAAASIETWLRGAWAKRPVTPRMGSHKKPPEDLDLIELTDTNSDDGRMGTIGGSSSAGLCRHPVRTLWTQYSGAGDPSSGHNIRLTVCKNCGRFCDKYVEHDFVVLFIDLVLIKPQVYRHLLHNTLMREHDQFDPSIIRLGTLLLLFDVYLTWARIEKQTIPLPGSSASSTAAPTMGGNLGSLSRQPIVLQYMFFRTIRFLTSSRWSPLALLGLLPTYPRPNSVSTALLVSSSTKLFPILMVVWDYDVPAAARSLGWAVVANNVEALEILLDCGYPVAVTLAAAGALARWAVGRAVLWLVGLERVDVLAETVGSGAVMAASTAGGGGTGGGWGDGWGVLGYAREWAGRLAVG
ncbi:Arv1-like family-domain-containing protein [Biscogniauxia mediterranea]|nr:Arv1-like family-domain-containing protein [Biscogniauxia mediterranea]